MNAHIAIEGGRTITRLAELAVSLGDPFASAGNLPILLDNPKVGWFVEHGALDVFLIEYRDGQPVSSAKHLLRAGAGRLVFGMGENGPPLVAVAKGLPGSKLRRVVLAELVRNDVGDDLADQVDAWISEFSAAVARQIEPRPKLGLLLNPANLEETLEADAGTVLSTRPGGVLWALPGDTAAYLGTEEPEPGGTGLVPLTSDTWLTLLKSTAAVTGVSSRQLSSRGTLLQALDEFHRLALGAEQLKPSSVSGRRGERAVRSGDPPPHGRGAGEAEPFSTCWVRRIRWRRKAAPLSWRL